jgi:hypothetical protein
MMAFGEQLTPKPIYQMVAELGFRKYFHFGGFQATQELLKLFPIDPGKAVLDVGCANSMNHKTIGYWFEFGE